MAYLNKIIQQVEANFHIHVHGHVKEDLRVESVQFLTLSDSDKIIPDPTTLYIGNYETNCNVCLDSPVLLYNCKYADVNENVLHVYQSLNPLELCNCIQNEIHRSHRVNLKKEEMFHVLQSGYGVQSIINTARTFLHNPITICNTSFSIIAVSPVDEKDNKFEAHNKKLYLKKDALQNMRDAGIMNKIFSTRAPFVSQLPDYPDTNFLFCSIHIKRAAVGYICVRSTIRPFTEDDSNFVAELSKMLSIEMQKDNFSSQKSGLTYEYFLTDLIECNLDNLEFAKRRFDDLGRTIYQYFWVFTFSFSDDSTNHLSPSYYIDQLGGIFRNGMSFFYKRTLVMLLTGRHTTPFIDIDTKKFYNFLQMNQMQVATSYRYENLLDTHIYYKQALFQLKSKKCLPHDRSYRYEDNYLYHILEQCQGQIPLKSLIHPDITFLINYDNENKTEYTNTLRCFILNERNALKTANDLHIHKSTFFYRWGKIVELLELAENNGKSLFAYEFSFAILDYTKIK